MPDEPKQDGIPAEPATPQSGFKVSTAPVEDPAGLTMTTKPPMPTMQLSTDKPDDDAGLSSNVPPKPQSPASETPVESAVEKKKDDKKDENDGQTDQKDGPDKAKFKDIETVPKGDTDAAKLKDAVMKTNSNLSAVVHNFREAYKEIKDNPDSLKDQVKDSLHLTEGAQGLVDKVKEGFDKVKNLLTPRPSGPSQDASSDEKEKKNAEVSPAKQTPGPGETANDVDPKLTNQMGKVDNESVDVAQSATSLPDKSTPGSPTDPTTFAASEKLANAPAFDSIAKDKSIPEPKPQLDDQKAGKYKI